MGAENGTGPEPVFDFSGINRTWGKRWMRRINRASDLQVELAELEDQRDDLPEDQQVAAMKRLTVVLHELETIGEEQEQLIAQVLVSVPREWLSDDAPKDLDWSKSESLDWVLEVEYPTLVQALQTARQQSSKNSANGTA